MLCMGVSAFYHTFNPMNKAWNDTLLRFDLVFVGLMILTLTNCLTFVAYSAYPTIRNVACIMLLVIQVILFVINMLPKFSEKEYENYRRILYSIVLLFTTILALLWLCWIATGEERLNFIGWVVLSLFWLNLGMFFYASKYPEKRAQKSRFVAYWLSSHTIWHICAALSANQLLWLQWRYNIHVEQKDIDSSSA